MNFMSLLPLITNLVPLLQEVQKLVSEINPEEVKKIVAEFEGLIAKLKPVHPTATPAH